MAILPATCTFANPDLFITIKGEEAFKDLCQKADNRNQDAHDLYIYNNFNGYGLLDLIDKTLSTIHTKIVKKNLDEAYSLFEALVEFADCDASWAHVDDGERVELTNKAMGALLVSMLRGLKKNNRLDIEHFPSLRAFLKNCTTLGKHLSGMSAGMGRYDHVCEAIGFRLFNGKEAELKQLDEARLEEWLSGLPAELGKEIRESIAEREKEREEEGEEKDEYDWWKAGSDYNEDVKNPDFSMGRVWKEYREYLSECPTLPLRGPPEWDLTKWTADDKAEF